MPYRTLSAVALFAALVAPTASAQQAASPRVVASIDPARGADGAVLRADPVARPVAARTVKPVVHGPAGSSAWSPSAARDARMAALQARLDALDADVAEFADVDERLVVFSGAGTMDPIHRETFERYVDMLRPGEVALLAEACAPADDAGGARLRAAVARAFDAAGATGWTVRAQRAPCSLPGSVVLRPAR